jgi:ZIP family zinc transporter
MEAAGFSRQRQFWAAVLTSAPQPIGAVAAFLVVEHVEGLLPASFAFAAGAMLALVAFELVPQIPRQRSVGALAGSLAGAVAMLALAAVVGV